MQCTKNCDCDPINGTCETNLTTENHFASVILEPYPKSSYFNKSTGKPKIRKPQLQKYHTFNENPEVLTTTAIPSGKTFTTQQTSTDMPQIETTLEQERKEYYIKPNTTTTQKNVVNYRYANTTQVPFTVTTYDIKGQEETDTTTFNLIAKSNSYHKLKGKVTFETTINSLDNMLQGDEWLNDDHSNNKSIDQNAKLQDNYKYVMFIIIIALVVITIIIVTITTLLRKKGIKSDSKVEKNIDKTTVSVYTKSIFHTPLPGRINQNLYYIVISYFQI